MPAAQAAPFDPLPPSSKLSNCPDCEADLSLLRIISGRAGAEYWTMRCTSCGGIHLDIVAASDVEEDSDEALV
jgi:uncharacterized Zn finger protein